MSALSFDELFAHVGHYVVVVTYGGSSPRFAHNVSLECDTCALVLVDFDREEVK